VFPLSAPKTTRFFRRRRDTSVKPEVNILPSSKKKHNVNTRLEQEKKEKREKEAAKKALQSNLPSKGKKK
jgi:hypothetical protein